MGNVIENMDGKGRELNGRFTKGHGGYKRAGLPEMQRATREKLWSFFEANLPRLQAIFEKLSDREQAKVLLATAEFFLPRQKEIFLETDLSQKEIDFSRWSNTDLQILVALQKKYGNGNGEAI